MTFEKFNFDTNGTPFATAFGVRKNCSGDKQNLLVCERIVLVTNRGIWCAKELFCDQQNHLVCERIVLVTKRIIWRAKKLFW